MIKQVGIEKGTKFSSWEYLGEFRTKRYKLQILCKCSCGTEVFVTYANIKNGVSTQCRKCSGTEKKDLTDKKFGKLTALKEVGKDKYGKTLWECLCDCGNYKITTGNDLIVGHTKSCGCLWREMNDSGQIKRHKTHEMSKTKIYKTWRAMLNRCNLKTHQAYHNYGGRGIQVCERWSDKKTGFLSFLADMGEPSPGDSIKRIDNNGNYELGNCQWIPKPEQNKNMRSTYKIKLNDEILCLSDVCKELNLNSSTIYKRIEYG